MNSPNWFEEKPSKEFKARVEHSADQEIERRERLAADGNSKRNLLSFISFEVLGSVSVAAIAGVLGFWLVNRDDGVSVEVVDTSLEVEDIDLLADYDILEELEIIESLKDEDMSS